MLIIKVNDLSLVTDATTAPAAYYRGTTYTRARTFRAINDAVVACRQDLDAGKFSLVVQEANQFSVWAAEGIPSTSR